MIEQTNFVRSYVFLLDHMIGDRPYKWPCNTCKNIRSLKNEVLNQRTSWRGCTTPIKPFPFNQMTFALDWGFSVILSDSQDFKRIVNLLLKVSKAFFRQFKSYSSNFDSNLYLQLSILSNDWYHTLHEFDHSPQKAHTRSQFIRYLPI